MSFRFTSVCKASSLTLAIVLGGFVSTLQAQHGSGAGGGVVGGGAAANAGATIKLPSKKPVTRPTTGNTTKPKPGPKPTTPDNSAQVEDALRLADEARNADRYEAAEQSYQLAARLAPNDPRPYVGLGHIYYDQKKYPDAEKFYARAAALAKGDGLPYARLAFTYAEMDRLDDALVAGRRSVATQPENYYGYLALGFVLRLRKSYAEAEATYRKSVSLAPQPLVVLHQELVRLLSEQRKYADAVSEAKKEVDADPKDFSARFDYALMLQKLGQLVPSSQQYLEAIKLSPKDSAPHSNIGLIYYMSENFTAAREHWSSAISLGTTYPPDSIGLLIIDGKLAEAQAQLEDYTKKSPDDEDGWLMLGDVYRALGNDSGARVTDARAAQIAPEYVGLRRPNLRSLRRGGTTSSNSSWTNTPANGPSNSNTGNTEIAIQRIYMAKNNNGKPGEPALGFIPSDRTIFCVIEFNIAKPGTQIRFVWKTGEIEGSRNEEIKTVDYTTKPLEDRVQGNLTLPRDWPTGTYKVDIYINGTFARTVNYRVS
ncbi:MAG TPA: tetratricopeptide repeat protein [Pyrinomonadaceae bacterium]|nr:tetratricopeptide repeat protein [Pyrinomonadaceae bacterium]